VSLVGRVLRILKVLSHENASLSFKKMSWYDTYVSYVSYHGVFVGVSKELFVGQYFKILRTCPTIDTLLYMGILGEFPIKNFSWIPEKTENQETLFI
jgi:hypothetical protein